MDGLILVHKPSGMTSHDAVVVIRKTLQSKKVGHFGTLDPWATGLLIIAVGKATRLFPLFLDAYKTYLGVIKLGVATDTFDFTGRPLAPEVKDFPVKATVMKAMEDFTGEILQVPPLYSAKKQRGKRLYVLARKNQEIEPKACKVDVQTFSIRKYEPPLLECLVRCSTGTYIRSLAHDLGQKLGCGAHLLELERTNIDPFRLEDSLSLDDIRKKAEAGHLQEMIIPMESLLPHLPKIVLTETGARMARNGNTIIPEHILGLFDISALAHASGIQRKEKFRLFSSEGRLLAIARLEIKKNGLHPFLVIDSGNESI